MRLTKVWRALIFTVIGIFFLVPILAMAEFSTRGPNDSRSLEAWKEIPSAPNLLESIAVSVQLAIVAMAGVVFLLVPTMIWVHLRLPALKRPLEAICLLPLTIPAIVLVVGIAPIYRSMYGIFGSSPLTLGFIYLVLVLPYSHRAINAALESVDVKTLAEASRTLGASTSRMIAGIVVPNIKVGIMSGAVISIALVLGEFTIANLLNFETMQVVINLLGKRDGAISVAVSLAALIFAFVLILILPTSNKVGSRHTEVEEGVEA